MLAKLSSALLNLQYIQLGRPFSEKIQSKPCRHRKDRLQGSTGGHKSLQIVRIVGSIGKGGQLVSYFHRHTGVLE